MSKVSPCLWFDGEAEEAANLYVSLLPDSRIDRIQKNLVDGPAGKAGSVLVVQFTLAGQEYLALPETARKVVREQTRALVGDTGGPIEIEITITFASGQR